MAVDVPYFKELISKSSFSELPTFGSVNKIYLIRDDCELYYWDGDSYELLSTRNRGQSILTASANTSLDPENIFYKLTGTFTDNGLNQNFTTNTNGDLTYNGRDTMYHFVGSSDLSVSNQCQIEYGLFRNGTLVPGAITPHDFAASARTQNISINVILDVANGDTFDIRARSDTPNVTVTVATLITTFTSI